MVHHVTDYMAVRDAVLTVRDLLRRHITLTAEAGLANVPIDMREPREIELANLDPAVSLWLYRVEPQPDLLNRRPMRDAPGLEPHAATPLELSLLVVPMAADAGLQLLLLGRIAQVLTDHRRLEGGDLIGSLAGTTTALQLGMDPLSSYDLSLVWGSQHTYARVGVGLRVHGVVVDSHLPPMSSSPVIDTTAFIDLLAGRAP
jgi:Pvc16 N-terminal domain